MWKFGSGNVEVWQCGSVKFGSVEVWHFDDVFCALLPEVKTSALQ